MTVDNVFISAQNVEYLKSEINYTYIHLINGACLLSSHNLGKVTTRLQLTRVHNRVSINSLHIVSIENGIIKMKSGYAVVPSRRKKGVITTLKTRKGEKKEMSCDLKAFK
jgi:DNA-binding LytR/AlgR family response regulator